MNQRMESNTWQLVEIVQSIYEAPAYHLILEGGLFIWVLWLILFRKSYSPKTEFLTEKEKEELIQEWQPEPLVPEVDPNHHALNSRVVSSKIGKYIELDGKRCLNLGSHNYLGFSEDKDVEERAIETLRKYGCGSCGPRAFFGTVDIHLELEKRLAQFMQVEETVLYSYGFSTVASAIPAYAKKGDIIFCDEAVNFSIQKGLVASRSSLRFFKHNDVDDLERLFKESAEQDSKNPKKAKVTRKFLVVEGLYANTGDICPLDRIIKLKNKYKVRLFVDESYSFGVLGRTGRGIKEHLGIDSLEIDNTTASLENSFASYGGFAAGTSFIVDHQRLSGTGYCFSASLPPLQAAAAIVAIDKLEQSSERISQLRKNCRLFDEELKKCEHIQVDGDEKSPIKHLRFKCQSENREEEQCRLESVVEYCFERGIALTTARYLDDEEFKLPKPSIRLIVNSMLEEELIIQSANMISNAFEARK